MADDKKVLDPGIDVGSIFDFLTKVPKGKSIAEFDLNAADPEAKRAELLTKAIAPEVWSEWQGDTSKLLEQKQRARMARQLTSRGGRAQREAYERRTVAGRLGDISTTEKQRLKALSPEDKRLYLMSRDLDDEQLAAMPDKDLTRALQLRNYVHDEQPTLKNWMLSLHKDGKTDPAKAARELYSGLSGRVIAEGLDQSAFDLATRSPGERTAGALAGALGFAGGMARAVGYELPRMALTPSDESAPGLFPQSELMQEISEDVIDEFLPFLDPGRKAKEQKRRIRARSRMHPDHVFRDHDENGRRWTQEYEPIRDGEGTIVGWSPVSAISPAELPKDEWMVTRATKAVGRAATAAFQAYADRTNFMSGPEKLRTDAEATLNFLGLFGEVLHEDVERLVRDPAGYFREDPLDFALWVEPSAWGLRKASKTAATDLPKWVDDLVKAEGRAQKAKALDLTQAVQDGIGAWADEQIMLQGPDAAADYRRVQEIQRQTENIERAARKVSEMMAKALGQGAEEEAASLGRMYHEVRRRNGDILEVFKSYAADRGLPFVPDKPNRIYAEESLGVRLADAYEAAKHAPDDPVVQASYDAFRNEIDLQWQALSDAGYKLEPWDLEGQPYANSKELRADVARNKRIYFFRGGDMPADHPLASINPRTGYSYNDMFRAVHDSIHAMEGYSFSVDGETMAWLSHSRLFSDRARPAMTTETLWQNSWVNFGKQLRDETGAVRSAYVPPRVRPFAENKAAVLSQGQIDEALQAYAAHGASGSPALGKVDAALQRLGQLGKAMRDRRRASGEALQRVWKQALARANTGLPADVLGQMVVYAGFWAAEFGAFNAKKIGAAMAEKFGQAHVDALFGDKALFQAFRDQVTAISDNMRFSGAAHINNGAKTFKAWKEAMVAEHGEHSADLFTESLFAKSQAAFDSLIDRFGKDALPTVQKIMRDYKGQSANLEWYRNSGRYTMERLFGDDWNELTALLAITSAGKSINSNTTLALRIYKDWKLGKNLSTVQDIQKDYLAAWEFFLATGELPQGGSNVNATWKAWFKKQYGISPPNMRKRWNFKQALDGNLNAVVSDVWMHRYYGFFAREIDPVSGENRPRLRGGQSRTFVQAPKVADDPAQYLKELGIRGSHVKIDDLPEVLYHVTTAHSDVMEKTKVPTGGGDAVRALLGDASEGGLGSLAGSSSRKPGVSLTTKKETAELIHRELLREGEIGRAKNKEEAMALIRGYAKQDAKLGGYKLSKLGGALKEIEKRLSLSDNDKRAMLTQYRTARETAGGQVDPVIFAHGSPLAAGTIDPKDIQIITVQRRQLKPKTLMSTGDEFLDEVRVHGDVSLEFAPAFDATPNNQTMQYIESRTRELAQRAGVEPSEMQAALWYHIKNEWEQLGWTTEKPAPTYGEAVRQRILAEPSLANIAVPGRHRYATAAMAKDNKGPFKDAGLKQIVSRDAAKIIKIHERTKKMLGNGESGSTFNPWTGRDLDGAPRWAVGMFPEKTKIVPGSPTKEQIEEFILENTEFLMDGRVNVGTWELPAGHPEIKTYKGGETHIDLSITFPADDFDMAAKKGQGMNQQAMHNLETHEDYMLGGTGEFDPEKISPKTMLNARERIRESGGIPLWDTGITKEELAKWESRLDEGVARAREKGSLDKELAQAMAGSVIGGAMLPALSAWMRDNGEGSRVSIGDFLLGGLMGFGVTRMMTDPRVRKALKHFTSLDKSKPPDLEAVFSAVFEPVLPDRIIEGDILHPPLVIGGMASGVAAGGYALDKHEFSEVGGIVGAGIGLMLGSYAGTRLQNMYTGFNPKKAYRRLFTEAGGLPDDVFATKELYLNRLAGTAHRIMDLSKKLSKFPRKLQRAMDDAIRGNITFDNLDEAARARFLENDYRDAFDLLPDEARDVAIEARLVWDDFKDQLIDVGLATGDLAKILENNEGIYAPILYRRFEQRGLNQAMEKVVRYVRYQNEPLSRLSERAYFMRQGVPEEVQEAYDVIRNAPGYLLGKRGLIMAEDIEFVRYANYVASSEHTLRPWNVKRETAKQYLRRTKGDYTRESPTAWVKRNGVRRPQTTEEWQAVARKIDEEEALYFREIEKQVDQQTASTMIDRNGRTTAELNGKTYVRMPENKRYGSLAGKYVDENIALDMMTQVESAPLLLRLLNVGTGLFKASKVTHNPATLMRNLYGNVIMADMGGLSPMDGAAYKQAWKDYTGKTRVYEEARDAGLFGGSYYGEEVLSLLPSPTESGSNMLAGAIDFAERGIKVPFDKMSAFHQGSEEFFKMAMYNLGRGRGMSPEAAVKFAQTWIFDYRRVPRWIQVMRKSPLGAPFISFSYKALPRVLQNALAFGDGAAFRRFWKYPAMLGAINEFSYHHRFEWDDGPRITDAGLLKDDQKSVLNSLKRIALSGLGLQDSKYKALLPEYLGGTQVLLPWRDRFGRLQYFDATWTLPWGDFTEIGKGQLGNSLAQAGVPFPRQLEPSNPWLQIAVAALTARDPFLERTVVPIGVDPNEGALHWNQFIWRLFSPQIAPGNFAADTLSRSFRQDVTSRTDTPSKPLAVAKALGGIVTRPNDPRQAYVYKAWELRSEISAIRSDLERLVKIGASEEAIKARKADLHRRVDAFKREFGRIDDYPEIPEELVRAMEEQGVSMRQLTESVLGDLVPEEIGE